jgi:hypothetical protein
MRPEQEGEPSRNKIAPSSVFSYDPKIELEVT